MLQKIKQKMNRFNDLKNHSFSKNKQLLLKACFNNDIKLQTALLIIDLVISLLRQVMLRAKTS